MQAVYVTKDKTTKSAPARTSEKFRYFPLHDMIPAGQILVLHTELGTLSLLKHDVKGSEMVEQQQFTGSELSLLLPLLELYPHYCPYEVMFASFYNGNTSEETVERCREQLMDAMDAGLWDAQMRPVRNVLSRIRLKMRTFGIDVASILETGYVLMKSRTR